MKVILNESPLSEEQIHPLIDFATVRSKYDSLTALALRKQGSGWTTAGWAQIFDFAAIAEAGVPSLITLYVGKTGYPLTTCYRASVGKVVFSDWKEEFLFVFAHELRHIDQFWGDCPRNYEVDAERHALSVLAEYRQQAAQPEKPSKPSEHPVQQAARKGTRKRGKRS
jgi:hypothetical protein